MILNPFIFAPSGSGGTFLPSDISSLVRWISADSLGGALSDGDPVSTAADLSGHGYSLTQSGSARPLYRTGITNGLPGIEFTASSSQRLEGFPISCTAATFAIAFQPVAIASLDTSLLSTAYLSDRYHYYSGEGYFGAFRGARIDGYPAAPPTTGIHTLVGISSSSAYELWIDGVSQGSRTANFHSGVNTWLGSAGDGSLAWNGYIFEFCQFDAVLPAGERADLETYLDRWT